MGFLTCLAIAFKNIVILENLAAAERFSLSLSSFGTEVLPDLWRVIRLLASGLSGAAVLFFLTLIFSIPLGIIVMFFRRSRFFIIRVATTFYISVMRGTPLMLQLIVFYYAPYYFFKITMNKMPNNWLFLSVVVAFSINYAAYFAEIFRSGLSSIPLGQYEAAGVLNFSKFATFIHIILPQMVKNVLPSVTNEVITLVKDTSLASTVSYMEMFMLAKQESALMVSPMPLFVAGIFYYVANMVLAFIMARVEKKFDYYHV